MYGLINKAVQGYLCETFGKEQWCSIAQEAGAYHAGFISLETYPDEITYALVAKTSARLSIPADTLWERLGEYWIRYTASEGYGEFFACQAHGMMAFLENLNAMHERMALIHPQMRSPKFELRKISADSYELDYFSTRQGLAAFVKGMLHGLSKQFNQPADIEHIPGCADKAGVHEIFRIRLFAVQDTF